MVRQAGEKADMAAINRDRKRARAEDTEADVVALMEDSSSNDVEKGVQRFIDSVAAKKVKSDDNQATETKEAPPTTEVARRQGYVGKKFDIVDQTQKYVLLSVVGPDVANKAYDANNELVKYHGLVVWGCVDSLDTEFYKDLQRKAAKSSDNAFHVLAMPTCSMVPLKFSEEELRGQVSSTWQDERVQELMDGARRQRQNAEAFFQQQKAAKQNGDTTPEMLEEQLAQLQRDKEKIQAEAVDMDEKIKELQLQLNHKE